MDPNRWKRIKDILDKALELSGQERAAYIEQECAADSSLLGQVDSLIAADDRAGELLEAPPVVRLNEDSRLEEGQQIGSYRISRLLGEGGMGIVYEAEQERPVQRKVALKLIKLGMDTRSVVARFESERQALALMSHPNIASVYDAGATEEGRPYFVMELVQGEPITGYCDEHRLSLRERLELFTQVCEGVQHAHQKGIIHRDIKPSNVLVTLRGDKPLLKIIDFGVAKATSQRLTEATVFTELGQLIGTPEYMSPEQAELTGQDIDTRTDVYSLGVLLYELLVGAQPFDSKTLRQAGFDEIRRKIREDDPPTPSSRLRTLGDVSTTAAHNRRIELPVLKRQLRGDLDWITMKALEKDRTRRYSTPTDLAADIIRHLNHEPVLAGPASVLYRSGKFIRRHKVGVTAAALVVVAIVAGGIAATVGFVRATQAEQLARQEAETATQVSDFLVELFEVSMPMKARGETITAREILDRGAERINDELKDQPLVQARMMNTIGDIYDRLGLYQEAESLLLRALEIRERILGQVHRDVERSLYDLAILYERLARYEEAEQFQRRVLAIREKLLDPEHIALLDSIDVLATLLSYQGKYDEAELMYQRAVALAEERRGKDSAAVGLILNNLAFSYTQQGRYEEAESRLRRSLDIVEEDFGADHPIIAEVFCNLAQSLTFQGEYMEAEELYRRTVAIQEKVLGVSHPDIGNTLNGMAEIYRRQASYDQAELLLHRALTLLEENVGEDHLDTAESFHGLAKLRRDQGRLTEAEPYYQRALAVREKLLGPNHPKVVETLDDYAAFLQEAGREGEAAQIEQRAASARGETP